MKQSKVWKLNEIDYEAIASFLWCDVDDVKKIYGRYKYAGLGVVLLSNYYLIDNEMVMGKISDLKTIVSSYSRQGLKILKDLFSSRFFEKEGTMYYSRSQLKAIGKENMITRKYIKEQEVILQNMSTVFPPETITSLSYVQKVLNNIIAHVNMKLPAHIRREIKENRVNIPGIDVENFYRLLNAYISIDSSFIGFSEMIKIQLKILHKDKASVKKLLEKSHIWMYDRKENLIYDPSQREAHNMNRIPSKDEVYKTMKRRLDRYKDILKLR